MSQFARHTDMSRENFVGILYFFVVERYPNTRAFVTIIIPIIHYCVYNYNTLYIQKTVSAAILNGSSSPKTLNTCNYILRLSQTGTKYMSYMFKFLRI